MINNVSALYADGSTAKILVLFLLLSEPVLVHTFDLQNSVDFVDFHV